jgi:hypothetical protein
VPNYDDVNNVNQKEALTIIIIIIFFFIIIIM